MSSLLHPTLTTREIIRMASRDVDSAELGRLAALSPTESLALMFDLCDAVRDLAETAERRDYPNAPEWEIKVRIKRRIAQANDLNFKEVIQWGQSIGALDGWKIEV